MKIKKLKALILKALLIIFGTTFGFAGFYKCDAQSIVGKWNQISSKQFLTAEGFRKLGKSVLETQTSSVGTVVFEFKADHSYVLKSSHTGDSGVLTLTGTWALRGNQLELKLAPKQEDPKYNPKKDAIPPKTTMLLNGNTMVTSTLYPDSKI
jgi:hypothetical protein